MRVSQRNDKAAEHASEALRYTLRVLAMHCPSDADLTERLDKIRRMTLEAFLRTDKQTAKECKSLSGKTLDEVEKRLKASERKSEFKDFDQTSGSDSSIKKLKVRIREIASEETKFRKNKATRKELPFAGSLEGLEADSPMN